MDDLLAEFIAETRETLAALSGEIVAWEADPADRTRLDAIFRFVHTVKGSCGFLDLPRLARLSHAAEDVLAAVRDGERVADKPLVDAVLAIVDRIGAIVEAIDAGAALDDAGEETLLAALAGRAAPQPAASLPRAPTRSVRLSVDLLDRMMGGMSEMVLARNELARRLRDGSADAESQAALERLSLTVADLRDIVTRTRMQRIDALFATLPRLVRDTAAAAGKDVALRIDGADVELDREMIEVLRDPLLHMVRNAIDHGIEPPAERRLLGKSPTGHLTVSARQSGNRILLEVTDDGRGIDVARLAAKVAAADPKRADALRDASPAALLDLVFEPGLSSRDAADDLSGRGVGMDVVRANVEAIGGGVNLRNTPGHGLTVLAHVPLTLAILPTVGVSAAGARFGVPRRAIDEIVAASSPALRLDRLGDALVATLRGRRLPVIDLAALLGLRPAHDPALLLIVDVTGGSYALGIDAVHDTEELVVKPAAPAVMASGLYAGQALPDHGGPLLLLDPGGLAAAAGLRFARTATPDPFTPTLEPLGEEALVFDDLDGARRAIVLAAIDRIERVPAPAISLTGGERRFADGNTLTTVIARGPLPEAATIPLIRLHDSDRAVAYAVAAVHDVVRVPPAPAHSADPVIAGVVPFDGGALELVDPLWLLGHAASTVAHKLCLIRSADARWLDRFARPVLEAAGYRVVDALAQHERADVVLAMESDVAVVADPAPVVRLSARKGRGVYRYDRGALVAAVAEASA